MAEERLEEAAKDMRNQMTAVAQKVFADAGISQFFDTFDVTTDEGLQKASTALSAISAVKSATDAITSHYPRWSNRRSPPRRSSTHGRRA